VEELQPNTWIKAFFNDFLKCDMLLNNHSEVFNSYILEAREFPVLSMLETIFSKIMHRNVAKQKEADTWPGTIFPKIRKKIDKMTEWAKNLGASHAGNGVYHVTSNEYEKTYNVDMVSRQCDCRRWQLTGIPCHHVIACCRADRLQVDKLVHSCYSIDTFKKAYAYNLTPLRSRVHWEKMNGPIVHPPIYTKVMGRPKKNRRKTPEEKEEHGVKSITRAGVTMHYSVCGNPNHNKKGHAKWVLDNLNGATNVEDDDVDDPSVMQHLMPITPDPRNDPMHQMRTLVHQMGQEVTP
jgi:hypothetical protein